MYTSGVWRGFWEQNHLGRQHMEAFQLEFNDLEITGSGTDIVGKFIITGVLDPISGDVRMTKKYLGKHSVEYQGKPDGEGAIGGRWVVRTKVEDVEYTDTGTFLMKPDQIVPMDELPVYEIG